MKRFFLICTSFLMLLTAHTAKAQSQEVKNQELPKTIKEVRFYIPAIASVGIFKPLNEKDLIGGKIVGGFVFPAIATGVFLEYRHYFSPMNTAQNISKGSFVCAVKPYYIYGVAYAPHASHENIVGISGTIGYEWKAQTGFFIRPAIEPNLPIIDSSKDKEPNKFIMTSVSQTLICLLSVGYKW